MSIINTSFQSLAQGQVFFQFGDDALLFGEGQENNIILLYHIHTKIRNPTLSGNKDALKDYICNIYRTMMTRGIRGTYVYACKPNLRKYLSQFMGQHIVPIRVDYIDLTAGATETPAPDDPFDGHGTASESDADAAEHSSEVTVGAILKHKVFGRGTCTFLDTEHGRITVDFSGTSKMFAWPSSKDNGILIPE